MSNTIHDLENKHSNCARVDGEMTRITISLDKEVEQKVKQLQESLSTYSGKVWSISKTINVLLVAGILSEGKFHINEWGLIQDFADGKRVFLQDAKLDEYVTNLVALKQWV